MLDSTGPPWPVSLCSNRSRPARGTLHTHFGRESWPRGKTWAFAFPSSRPPHTPPPLASSGSRSIHELIRMSE